MGLFSRIFKKKGPSAEEQEAARIAEEQDKLADDERTEADDLLAADKLKRSELQKRKRTMSGGSRTGLMFGQSQKGVS